MAEDPQAGVERRIAARHLLQHPLFCAEHEPDLFRLVRRHEAELDRWFTQRLGYRLLVDSDTARLHKSTALPWSRPLRTGSDRPLTSLEHVLLALVLASVAAGPSVVSLRDLAADVRSAAAEADISLVGDVAERRALVVALKWMIEHGLVQELHEHVEAYATDDDADAVLRIRPDRVALVPLPTLVGVEEVAELLDHAERRRGTRAWLRARLVEDPVVYRDDLTEDEWRELRRRLAEDRLALDEMFGLVIEARAEGVAAIDPSGTLADQRFPTGGTIGHAALLLIERLETGDDDQGRWHSDEAVGAHVAQLVDAHARHWSKDLVANPERLTARVVDLLVDLRLAERDADTVRLLPASARFLATERGVPGNGEAVTAGGEPAESVEQVGLW